ncbi:wax synthase family protein [Aspergillus aculeatinus CBS 121060]|uniref:Uncharacterized protein n=1 Tax=Aspergillus aculeatinus CBS 121060 TaxID=1448322 RepID=A0ACD1H962_9EURO|nr:hypothetical protein BO66DRAFT_350111 [Aspergillus aculeatinus CBS 121060]RAH69939.1 hypothetical protein BO66DRAFT_350111 [Aspergillus aculeatinus CBS 121060]
MFLNPILSMVLETVVVVSTLGFTPAQSALRPGALALLSLCVSHCLSTTLEYFVRTPWALLAGGYSVMLLFHFADVGLLTRWEFPGPSRVNKPTESKRRGSRGMSGSTWAARLRYGIWACFNARCIGTPEQARNIPQPRYQDRELFLRGAFNFMILGYIGLDVLGSMSDPEVGSRFLVASRVPFFRRLSEVTLEEILIRVFSAAASGVGLVCSQGGFYNLFAFVSVFMRWGEPQDWPPFYGSLSEAYSLRRLWSRVWHQSNTHKFRAIARFVAEDVLGLSPKTLAHRYAQILIVFGTSALMHFLIDVSMGLSFSTSGAVQFFCTQAFGLMGEDLAVRVYVGLRGSSRSRLALRGERIVGFLWVGCFLAWSLPAYVYPMLYRSNRGLNDSVVPVSIVGVMRRMILG